MRTRLFNDSSAHKKHRDPQDRYFDLQRVPPSLVPQAHAKFWRMVADEMATATWFRLV